MEWFFLVCAIFGGTIMVCQFAMTLIGLGDHGVDVPDDMPEVPHDLSHVGDGADHFHPEDHAHGSSWLFGILSFRTLVAATAFFGLAGYAAYTAEASAPTQITAALVGGAAAMFGVHWIMRSMMRLSENGTARLDRAIGQEGTVYLTIPAARRHAGKVQFKLQNRLVDYEAVTDHEAPLATGGKIRIVGLVGASTVLVEPLGLGKRNQDHDPRETTAATS